MCIVAVAVDPDAGRTPRGRAPLRFLSVGNRDERHDRPAAPLAPWPGEPRIVGGRDLEAGGTWLALREDGAYAVVTNVRAPDARRASVHAGHPTLSRGALVASYVRSSLGPHAFAKELPSRDDYPAFNLILRDEVGAFYTNELGEVTNLGPGLHGLSNHRLGTPWPKVERLLARLEAALREPPNESDPEDALVAACFDALSDRTQSPDACLPQTGVPLEIERMLSSAFVVSPAYGTRASTVVLLRADGSQRVEERSFGPDGALTGTARTVYTPR
ncbi:MAG: NRDE family protein [Polyangiaceae bacterium]